jgi:Ca-activated chloride channel family protein
MTPTLRITPLKHAIHSVGHGDLMMVVSVSVLPAEPRVGARRSPLNLALALDKSGSMGGMPLQQAKYCVSRIVTALQDGDRIAVIAYDNRVDIAVPATTVGASRNIILDAINNICVGGMTNMHAGWIAAAEAAATGLSPDVLTRLMILSDGNANEGLQDVVEFSSQAAALAKQGVATTTIGLGNSFNEELMASIARSGGGQATYGESADDLWPSFEAELGLLSATCGKRVRLRLESRLGELVVSDAFLAESTGTWILPDLAHGASIDVLVRVKRGKTIITEKRVDLLHAVLAYDDIHGEPAAAVEANCTVDVLAEGAPLVENQRAAVIVLENVAAALQIEASRAARNGDLERVRAIASKLGALAGENLLIRGMAKRMEELAERADLRSYGKEAAYGAASLSRGYRTSAPAGAPAAPFTEKRVRQGKKD